MASSKRLFVGIDFPENIKQECARVIQILNKEKSFEARFVPTDKLHITLAFIGDVPEQTITPIVERLERIKGNHFSVQLGELSCFKKRGKVKIIFLTLISKALEVLADNIKSALADIVPLEEKSFVSHITIARVKQVVDADALLHTLTTTEVEPVKFSIDSFALKESILHKEGAEYVTLLSQKLY